MSHFPGSASLSQGRICPRGNAAPRQLAIFPFNCSPPTAPLGLPSIIPMRNPMIPLQGGSSGCSAPGQSDGGEAPPSSRREKRWVRRGWLITPCARDKMFSGEACLGKYLPSWFLHPPALQRDPSNHCEPLRMGRVGLCWESCPPPSPHSLLVDK